MRDKFILTKVPICLIAVFLAGLPMISCNIENSDTRQQMSEESHSDVLDLSKFPHAAEYQVLSVRDYTSDPRRSRSEVTINSSASTVQERAHTVMKAAYEHQHKTGCTVSTAILGASAFLADKGRQFTYALADYAVDGGCRDRFADVLCAASIYQDL